MATQIVLNSADENRSFTGILKECKNEAFREGKTVEKTTEHMPALLALIVHANTASSPRLGSAMTCRSGKNVTDWKSQFGSLFILYIIGRGTG